MGSAEYVVGPPESGAGEIVNAGAGTRATGAARARDRKRRSPPHVTAPPPRLPRCGLQGLLQGLLQGAAARVCCGCGAGVLLRGLQGWYGEERWVGDGWEMGGRWVGGRWEMVGRWVGGAREVPAHNS